MAQLKIKNSIYHIEGVLFDKDGTLIELHQLWTNWFEQVWDEVQQHANVNLKISTVAASIGLDLKSSIISARGPLAMGTLQDIAIILTYQLYHEHIPWNDAVHIVRKSIDAVHQKINWDELLQPVKGLKSFLQHAKDSGLKMGVVTSDDTDIAKKHLKQLEIDHFFHSITGSDQIDFPKPFPDIGEKVCQEMNIDANEVIVIGDTNGDMILGKNLKAKASIGIVSNENMENDHLKDANYIINHYDQLSVTKT